MPTVSIADVQIPEHRHRMQDPASVRKLMESIREVGLINPITITADKTLVSGLHRLSACGLLGWTEIPAVTVELGGLWLELAEIDENLIRNELTALERAEHYARRKEIYESLHPETVHGTAGAVGKHGSADPESGSAPAFIDDTAAKTGRSRSAIAEEVKIGRDLAPDVKQALREKPAVADNKQALSVLASAPVEVQREIAKLPEKEILAAAKEIRQRKTEERRTERLANLARDKAAELASVSPRSVANAAKVIERGAPELGAAVRSGNLADPWRVGVDVSPEKLQALLA